MQWLNRLLDRVGLALVLLGGAVLIVSMVWTTADVIGTQVFGWPIPGSLELVSNNMVLVVFASLAWVQRRRGHIRVEFFRTRAGPRGRAALDAVAHTAAIVFFGLLLWQAAVYAVYSWQIRESTAGLIRFPIYPARFAIVIGAGLVVVQLVLDVAADVRDALGKKV